MSAHQRFSFNTLEDIEAKARELNLDIRFSKDLSPLSQGLAIKGRRRQNRIAILPIEGCDSSLDGSPPELARRRYKRLFNGVSSLIWWEANAVTFEAKANEHQMMITDQNQGQFKALMDQLKKEALNKNGFSQVSILQLTHSGRYSRP